MAFVVAQRFAPIGKQEIRVDFLRLLKRVDRVFPLKAMHFAYAIQEVELRFGSAGIREVDLPEDILLGVAGPCKGHDQYQGYEPRLFSYCCLLPNDEFYQKWTPTR